MLLIILKQQVNGEGHVNGSGEVNKEVDRSSNCGIGESWLLGGSSFGNES